MNDSLSQQADFYNSDEFKRWTKELQQKQKKKMSKVSDAVFILYGGSSEDGRGDGVYETFTRDPQKALDFFYKNIANNAYSTGKVIVYEKEDYHVVQTKMSIKYITKYIN